VKITLTFQDRAEGGADMHDVTHDEKIFSRLRPNSKYAVL